jgi:hypothetical protein
MSNNLLEKGNPNRDPSSGRFTHGSGGGSAGGSGGSGSAEAESGSGAGGGSAEGEVGQGKDITSELGQEYGTTSETKLGQKLRVEDADPTTKGDVVLDDIAKRQGFDGKADLVDQKEFDKIVAEGGTVTHRGIGAYYDGPSPSAKYIEGESAITEEYAQGKYFAGAGGYGSGTYTSTDRSVAEHYATEGGEGGAVVTMVVKPGAKIATPQQWQAAREAARTGKGGFMGADNEGRILAAQGFDGFRVAAKNVDHFSNEFVVVLNRNAVAVLKK